MNGDACFRMQLAYTVKWLEISKLSASMKIGIVGLGLIGGSMAIDLKRKGFAQKVMGVEADPVNASAAKQIGLVDETVTLEECVAESDIVVLAVPVGAAFGSPGKGI